MREINEAWAVLGESARRTRYDEELHRAADSRGAKRATDPGRASTSSRTTPGQRAAAREDPSGTVDDPDDADDLEDIDLLRPVSRGEAFLLQRGPWIAAVLIALVLLVGTAYAGSVRPAPTRTPTSLQSGIDCVDTPAEPCGP